MGCTFGDKGFYQPKVVLLKSGKSSPKIRPEGQDFKENILLSFYNWPKVETSAVFKASIENRELKQAPSTLPF